MYKMKPCKTTIYVDLSNDSRRLTGSFIHIILYLKITLALIKIYLKDYHNILVSKLIERQLSQYLIY